MNITIVGGGFGGIKTALELAKNSKNIITLISDKPDFQYYPALYGAATGQTYLESWVPLSKVFVGKKNIKIQIDTIEAIDPKAKILRGASNTSYAYETCVLALGSVTTYFGIEGLDVYSYGIKSAEEIKRLKEHLHQDIARQHQVDKHYVVIGGGPTGVELAAALGSYINRLCEHYGVSQKDRLHIDLIEAAPRLLPKMHEKTSKAVEERLKKLGVTVQTGQAVQSATADAIMVSGKPIKSHTVIWTSGVANHSFFKDNAEHFNLAKNGKVIVNEFMQAAENLYVIGDNAATPYSGLAQTALHDALYVADVISQLHHGRAPKPYRAVKPPVVIPVGDNWAVCEWNNLRMYGWLASIIRRAADFIGYSDMLPLGQALGVWRATFVTEDEDFTPAKPENSTSK